MRGWLASPRRRRRLARLAALLAATAAVGAVVVWDPGGVDPRPGAPEPERAAPSVERPRPEPYTPLPVTSADRRAIDATVDRFVATAVVRRNPGAAWSLASEEMRAGGSRRDWERGELPVVPYPADALGAVDWSLGYVDRDAVVVDVMIQPKPRSGERVQVYSVQLSRGERPGRWLVDSWIPAATLGAPAPAARQADETPRAVPPLAFDDARLSAWWFLAPALFLALLVLTPLVLMLRAARSRRRADRAYRDWQAG